MANREARRELLAPSFIVMVTALACGGTAGTEDGDKDPNVAMNPPPATGGSSGSGVVSVNPPSPTGGYGGATVSVNPPSPTGGYGGDLVVTNPPAPGGYGGVGGAVVSVNPPAPCPPTMPAPTSRCTNPINNQLRCNFSSQACADILAVCDGEAWTLDCLDGAGGEPAAGGRGGAD